MPKSHSNNTLKRVWNYEEIVIIDLWICMSDLQPAWLLIYFFRLDLGPKCLLKLSVVGKGRDIVRPPVVLEQKTIISEQTTCIPLGRMCRVNSHDTWKKWHKKYCETNLPFPPFVRISLSILEKRSIMHFHQSSGLVFKLSCPVIQNVKYLSRSLFPLTGRY